MFADSKQASMEWHHTISHSPKKIKVQLSARKFMAIVFRDATGSIHMNFLTEERTINAVYYCELLEKVKTAV